MNLLEEYIVDFRLYKNNSKTGIVIETNVNSYFFHGSAGNLKLIGKMGLGSRSVYDFGDLNLDGYKDIIVSKGGEIFSLIYDYSNDTLNVFDHTAGDSYKNCYNASLIDIDENGSLDLVYRKFNDLMLRKNNGIGTFNEAVQLTSLTPSNLPQENLKFDFNNDGKQVPLEQSMGL